MIVTDILYGTATVEDVLKELINCAEVQRLKDIHMIGPTYLLKPCWNETRYEHSLGVMLLIRRLGGSLEEQIAGLLHDISHTIFSHTIDLVMNNAEENYHEEIKAEFLKKSSIPAILARYGFDYNTILRDDKQWKILEQEAPLLCADRIDYTLREVYRYFGTDLTEIHQFVASLEIIDNDLVLNNLVAGEWFIEQYYKVVIDLFYDPLNVYSYEIMSQILAYALERNYLTTAALMKTESTVIAELKQINDSQLKQLFKLFYAPVSFEIVSAEEDYDIFQKKKNRLVNPIIKLNSQLVFTADHAPLAKKRMEQTAEKSTVGIYLRVLYL